MAFQAPSGNPPSENRPRRLLLSLGGCHPDPRLGPIPVQIPSRAPSRFTMYFVLQRFGPIQVPRWGASRPVLVPSWSRAFLPGSGLDGPKQTSWPLPTLLRKFKCFFRPHLPCKIVEPNFRRFQWFSPQILVGFQSILVDFLSSSISFSQFRSISISFNHLVKKRRNLLTTERKQHVRKSLRSRCVKRLTPAAVIA